MPNKVILPHLPALTGLRAWAFVLVLLDHWIPFFHHVLMTGNGGVSLFLVLSGYLISRLLIASKMNQMPFLNYLSQFYHRRILRIVPLYYLTLAVLLLAGNQILIQHWIRFFTFTANYFLIDNPNPALDHFWSIAAEEQVYFILPVLIWLIPLRQLPFLAYSLIGISILFRGSAYCLRGGEHWWTFSYESVLGCFDCYGIGLLVAFTQYTRPTRINIFFSSALMLRILFLCWMSVLLLGIYWELKGYGPYSNPVTAVAVRLSIALFGGYLIGYCQQPLGKLAQLCLLNPVVQYVGTISFGLYVLHNLIFNAQYTGDFPSRLLWLQLRPVLLTIGLSDSHWLELTFYFLLTICLASLSWYLLEKPLLNRQTRKRKPVFTIPYLK